MNYWTLQFQNRNLEQTFSSSYQNHIKRCHEKQKWLIVIILLLLIVDYILQKTWIDVSLCCICLLLLFLSQVTQHRTYLFGKVFTFAIIFLLAIYKPNSQFFSGLPQKQVNVDSVLTSLAAFCLIHNFRILKQCLVLLFIFIFNMAIQYDGDRTSPFLILQNLFYILIILLNIYQKEEFSRINFIEDVNQIKINEILQNSLNVQLFRVVYDKNVCQFVVLQHNLQTLINQSDQVDFNNQIRQIKISIKKNKRISEQIVLNSINKSMSLEQFLLLIMNQTQNKLAKEFLDQDDYQLFGVLNLEEYTISVHRTYYIQPCVVLIIKKNFKEHQIEELKLKREILRRGMDTVQDIFFQNIKPCLIYYTWINKFSDKKKDQTKIELTHRLIQAKLYKAQNEYQNLKDFFYVNKSFQKTIIRSFNIEKVMKFIINTVVDFYLNKKKIKISFQNLTGKKEIFQDQAQFIQLFFNLLFYITEKSEQITITFKEQKQIDFMEDNFQVKIDYLGLPIQKQHLQKLPIINPQNLSEYSHNTSGTFNLDLPIALMIIRKLGPQDKLVWRQINRGEISLEFILFTNLPSELHLLPIISFKPYKNIVYKYDQTKRRTVLYDELYLSLKQQQAIETNRETL